MLLRNKIEPFFNREGKRPEASSKPKLKLPSSHFPSRVRKGVGPKTPVVCVCAKEDGDEEQNHVSVTVGDGERASQRRSPSSLWNVSLSQLQQRHRNQFSCQTKWEFENFKGVKVFGRNARMVRANTGGGLPFHGSEVEMNESGGKMIFDSATA
ncbi:hypothetical protein TNCV_3957741 [Trichonephila clavipes]|nr:hypothetical protein TNCV_3957741 [Trichonephila clavipes]